MYKVGDSTIVVGCRKGRSNLSVMGKQQKEKTLFSSEKSSMLMNLHFSEVGHGDKDSLEGVGFDES